MNNVEKIRAEVERRLWLLVPKVTFQHQRKELENILSFIDSLPEEPISEDLETAWVQTFEKVKDETLCVYDHHSGFVDGVQWQKEQDIKKACEWIKQNVAGWTLKFIEDFKKAMEGER